MSMYEISQGIWSKGNERTSWGRAVFEGAGKEGGLKRLTFTGVRRSAL